MAVVWLIDLFGDYQSTNSKPPPPLPAQIVNPVLPHFSRRTLFYDGHTTRDIGNLGRNRTYAMGLNDSGHVVGRSQYAGGRFEFDAVHAFRWRQGAGIVELGSLGQAAYSYAQDVNNLGFAAGASYFSGRLDERFHAVRWSPDGTILDLGTFWGSSAAMAINEAGQITGNVGFADGNTRAFFWMPDAGMMDMGSLGSGGSGAIAMNASGQVTGNSPPARGRDPHAFSWKSGGRMIDLGTLGGRLSRAVDINGAGQIAGVSTTPRGDDHAFYWSGTGRIVDLGTFGGARSYASQINREGVIVGQAMLRNGSFHGFSWTPNGGKVDLNRRLGIRPRGLVIENALGIADNGTIVAESNAGLVVLKPGMSRDDAPVLGPLLTPSMFPFTVPYAAVSYFIDANASDTHRASWTWGDGSRPEAATINERNAAGRITGTHRYREPGTYMVTLTVTDSGGRQSSTVALIAACDPTPGVPCYR
jgi:probable HAF family extracellular repeat protein